jgi:4-azaleucine resistance transporter AzlC
VRQQISSGFRATAPVAIAVAPFGLAYGAVASQSMPVWQASLMSVTVFAGTAQFVTASMLSSGAAYWTVLLTGLLINVRMVLLSASLAAQLGRMPLRRQFLVAHLLTDESFAVTMAHYREHPPNAWYAVGSGLAIFAVWQSTTVLGAIMGARIPADLGLEFALPASLICLLFLLIRRLDVALCGLFAALLSLALRPLVTAAWSTLVATCLAATMGVLYKQWRSRS